MTAVASSPITEPAPSEPRRIEGVVVQPYVHAQFLADVGRVSALGVTIHLELGTTMPDGTTLPRAHVMMSREFAQSLAAILAQALTDSRSG